MSRESTIDCIEENIDALISPEDVENLAARLGDKKIVMLGEATHGTSDFYSIRAALSEILIRDYGFKFIAVEGDWPDASRLRRYIQNSEGESAKEVLTGIHRWPRWMWANTEVAEFTERIKKYRTPFYGLDVYSLFESMEEVLLFLKKENPFLARKIAERYSCFNACNGDEITYAKSLLHDRPGCRSQVLSNLQDLLEMRISAEHEAEPSLFDARQNARIVVNAENYYREMLRGDASSWNVRDHHMEETLELLVERHGKAIVWAHNTHVGDYRATDMKAEGYVSLGGLARQHFGDENVGLVGFGTYQGKVTAGHAWGALEEEMNLPPARDGSAEECFHIAMDRLQLSAGFVAFNRKLREGPLAQTIGHRAVGVVYDGKQERRSQYVPTILTERYDAFIFVDKTTAIHPIYGFWEEGDIPETWPMGQ